MGGERTQILMSADSWMSLQGMAFRNTFRAHGNKLLSGNGERCGFESPRIREYPTGIGDA